MSPIMNVATYRVDLLPMFHCLPKTHVLWILGHVFELTGDLSHDTYSDPEQHNIMRAYAT